MRIDLRRPNSMVAHMALQRLPTGDRVKSGAFDYLVKPFDPRTIVLRVSAARIMEKIGARNAADLVRVVLSGRIGRAALPAMVT